MSSTKRNALTIRFVLSTTQQTEPALIDSGATENFLDPRIMIRLRLPTERLAQPRTIHNIDGTQNKAGSIRRKCRLTIHFGQEAKEMDFFVTDLGQDRIVLGFPFLRHFNPDIDWGEGKLRTHQEVAATPCDMWTHKLRVWKFDGKEAARNLIRKVTFAQQWAAKANEKIQRFLETDVPFEYRRHKKVFSEKEAERLPPLREENMTIPLIPDAPSQLDCSIYPMTAKELDVLDKTIRTDLRKGYIRSGNSSFVSPVFFIPKKDGEELRMVIDYRKLNDVTVKDFYPLPNLRIELEKLSKQHLFSKFDIRSGYNNIRIVKEDQHKAAFKTTLGTYIPTVMTFGFCNAPSIFQRAMNRDFLTLRQNYPTNFCNYMDDVAIGTDNTPEGRILHAKIIHDFLDILERQSYFLKASKCAFEKTSIEFLGFCVGHGTVRVDQSKIGGIADWPRDLKSVKEVRQILGVLGYQRAFIPNYAKLARPLNNLLKKDTPFHWSPECRQALEELIGCVTRGPVLTAPNSEMPFELETDASAYAVGAALFQKDERGKRRAIGYASKTLNAAERNYDVWDREFLALIFGLTYWRHLLSGTQLPVQVFVDHANLLHYRHPQKINRRIARYILTLADYNIQLHHRPGTENRADAMSRRPDYDDGKEDNSDITPIPPQLFIDHIRSAALDTLVLEAQETGEAELIKAQPVHGWEKIDGLWTKEGRTIVISDTVKREVLREHHNHPTAGHPGAATTYFSVRRFYWWPRLKEYVQAYVKGCGVCQQAKPDTRPRKPPLYPITPKKD